VRLRKTLVDTRTEWLQRIHAVLFHHGAKLAVRRLDGRDARDQLAALSLAPSACQQIEVALAMVEHVNAQLAPRQAVRFAGLDVTVHESDDKRRPGHLSRQGPPVLRWAAFEAAAAT
jgi:transposase